MDFTHYSVDDFLLDESFQAYVAEADSEAGRFWAAWLAGHPAHQAAADQAYILVQGLHQALPCPVPAGLKYEELQRLRRALHPVAAPLRLRSQRRAWRLAGTLGVGLLAAGLGWWQWLRPAAPALATQRYITGPGQQRTLTLPDGSVVTLNGNSTLTLAPDWTAATPREVWLAGEGYFRVAHRATQPVADIAGAPANIKFVVHAGELSISVLGTQFDVDSRASGTKVVLSSGKVAVARPAGRTRERLLMEPGDLVETSAARPGLMRRRVQPAQYSAWTQGQLKFYQTPVRDIVQLLHDTYGLRVSVADSALLRQTITGAVPAATPEILLPALAKALDIKATRSGNAVRLEAANR